ncbi:hypothetical protein QNO07_10535 [Streptomyces sp. 549]|uniref:hypothetical protein n=1 Tax=Streptomyces sp. 549 TaxID=3049076 RepID=UPI0024C24EB8|nr:hypothetical protein [Streptomyces sp. 549]MDK1473852.1 hypothetical protein [Streptomyces sp. 549]
MERAKKASPLVLVVVAVFGGILIPIGCAESQPSADRDTETLRVTFRETSDLGSTPRDDPRGSTGTSVNISALHRSGDISVIHFRIEGDYGLAEERWWESESPEKLEIRDWRACSQSTDVMPEPHPITVRVLLKELFGPKAIPDDAKVTKGGAKWERNDGFITFEYVDHGGEYPDRTVTTIGPDGGGGSRISEVVTAASTDAPRWGEGWKSCAAPAPAE